MYAERIQALIHTLEVDGARWLNYLALTLMVIALGVRYDTHAYRSFSSPEAMDAAQVARNLSEGRGFTTEFIRPFSLHLIQKHNLARGGVPASGTNLVDNAEVYGPHPDLANAPLYPVALAGLMKLTSPAWQLDLHKTFWSESGQFRRYKPEFIIAIFNQILLLVAVLLTFLLARTLFDAPAAWLSAVLMLFSDELWKYSVSGLPVILLMVIFLGLAWCLAKFELQGRAEHPDSRRQFMFALLAGLLVGLGMLTRYSFGWLIIPVFLFFMIFGGTRRAGLAVAATLVFIAVIAPWIIRNLAVSGTFFGTAGYALLEGIDAFPGSRLMQSLSVDLTTARRVNPYLIKLFFNLRSLLLDDVLRLGGGWMGILFLAGLLLGLRNLMARRLRYFTMMALGTFLVVSSLGRTSLTTLSPGANTENLLILLMPLAVIFGVAFFLTLLNQMELPTPQMQYFVVVLMILLVRLQFTLTLLPPQTNPVSYPPYSPKDIQKISAWLQPNELMMSDVPWAVAWYGDRQCTWTTVNCKYEFVALNDFLKPVNALYLTLNTLDGRLVTECVQGGVDSWSNFAYKNIAFNQPPANFPLMHFPLQSISSGLFLTDRQRW